MTRNWLAERRTKFEAERLAALRSIESSESWVEARASLRAYFRNNSVPIPASDEALLAAAHNERLRVNGLTLAERSASRDWLRDRGHDIS